ncbi:histidine kinase [Lutibacter sp. TH_r2]|uniref:sensor histidine kinase n=1 Tax=Lutibacter sp. TH_r2 TaxID=3082083 RepID=UPI00295574E9|nr:histidine kinase [Lutibacter sp. TH_r2]MDV7186366.1 histidine kinase [Lutibacter sp. TH_r2]
MKLIKKNYNFSSFEPFIIIAFWSLLFASPLLFGRFENQIEWDEIYSVWINYLPLLGLFLVNRFFLLPKLFFKQKKTAYFITTSILILVLSITIYTFEGRTTNRNLPPDRIERLNGNPPPMFPDRELPPQHSQRLNSNPRPIPLFANFLILAVLLVGFDTGLQISMRWANLEQEKFKLQKENVENQLAFLKNQVSPHFFMNTLNNIHALVDIDTEEAKSAIIKLSNLMRHLLYDSEGKTNPIKKEIEFIESYIELMKLRFSSKVKVNVEIPSNIPDKTIPPLLFTSLLENAFKHGISYNKTSFINILMNFSDDKLYFEIENSNHPKTDEEASGIGIENTKKRLALLFKDNFDFEISDTEEVYKVNLNIPL